MDDEDRTRERAEARARDRMDEAALFAYLPRERTAWGVAGAALFFAAAYLFLSPPFGAIRAFVGALGIPMPEVSWIATAPTLAIHLWVSISGLLVSFAGFALFRRENGALDYVSSRARSAAERIASERAIGGSIHLDEIHDDLLPPMRSGDERPRDLAVLRMVEGLHISAQTLRVDPIAIVVANYLPEMMEASRRLRALQTTAIRLGILGTFVGLVAALVPVADIFQSRTEGGQAGTITIVLVALSVAFLTSIAGLIAALLLQVLGGALQAQEGAFARRLEEVAARVQMVFALSRQDGRIVAALESMSTALDRARDDIGEKAKIVHDAGRRIGQAIVDHGDVLESRLATLSGTRDGLLDLADRQKAQIDRLLVVYDEMSKLDERLAAAFTVVGDRQIEALRITSSATLRALRESSETTVAAIRNGLGREALDTLRSEAETRFAATAAVLEKAAAAQGDGLGRRLDAISERLERGLTTRIDEGRDMVEAFDGALDRLERLVRRQGRVTLFALALSACSVAALAGLGAWGLSHSQPTPPVASESDREK